VAGPYHSRITSPPRAHPASTNIERLAAARDEDHDTLMPGGPARPTPLPFFGAGAVGSLLALAWRRPQRVTLVGRQEHVEAVTRGGVRMSCRQGQQPIRQSARPTSPMPAVHLITSS